MTEHEEDKQPSPIDEETLESIQDTLYNRLREPLLLEIRERLIEQAAEQPIPLYYDRFIAGQTQRLEEAIERNTQRILDLQRDMDRRFTEAREDREALCAEMDRRFTEAREDREALRAEMDRRFTEAREDRAELRAEMNRRFEAMDAKLDRQNVHMRNWVLAAVAMMSVIVAILQLVLK